MYNIVEWPDGRESQNEGWLHYLKSNKYLSLVKAQQVVVLTGRQEHHTTTCCTALLPTSNYDLTRRDQQIT
jgi:hypothetical protein